MSSHGKLLAALIRCLAPLMIARLLSLPVVVWAADSRTAGYPPPPPRRLVPDAGVPADPPSVVYSVAPGDDLNQIAQRFDTQVQALIYANQLSTPVVLHVGQQLTIPVLPAQQTTMPAHPRTG